MILILRYFKERFNVCLFIPLSVFLAIGSETSVLNFTDKFDIFIRAASALLLLLWFRLWDDLCSREKDKKAVPDRITVDPHNSKVLWKWFFILFFMSLFLVYALHHATMLLVTIVLAMLFVLFYALRNRLNQIIFDLLILIKYPIIAFVVSSENTPFQDKIFPLLMIYLILVVYEVFHDRGHLSDRNYLYAGYIAWLFLLIGCAAHIVLRYKGNQYGYVKWGFLSLCLAIFLLAVKYEKVRNLKIIPFANGIIYLGLLAGPH
jgi:hypothetical protein